MGGRDWRQAVHAAHSATNIVLETSGALDRSKLSAAVEVLGAHRIVFGSGSPATGVAAALGMVEDAAISDDARRRILWDNAVRLFELE
jgi:predicted TIM-barrel fold metal-dependent hydrolase